MTGTSASRDVRQIPERRPAYLQIALGGVLTGVLTPLLQPWIDRIQGAPGDVRFALLAIPFAILVLALVRSCSDNPWWAAIVAALVTVIAFLCAVHAATWVDAEMTDGDKAMRDVVDGLGGGFAGSAVMALGIGILPASPRDLPVWLPMLVIGTLTGALLALDLSLDLDRVSVLFPVWQAGVAVGLAMALRHAKRL